MSGKKTDCCITSSTKIQTDCQADWVNHHVFLFILFFFFLNIIPQKADKKKHRKTPMKELTAFVFWHYFTLPLG